MFDSDIWGILFAIILVMFFGAMLFVLLRGRRPRRRNRRLMRDRHGNVVAYGETPVGEAKELNGWGAYTGERTQLKAGYYMLNYELDAPTRVALISTADGSEETILISSGAGLKEIIVDQGGTYIWKVEPNVHDSAWKLTYRPMRKRV